MKTLVVEKSKIRANLETVKAKAGKSQVIAVLKANAYGLGLREMAQLCREASIRRFAVTEPEDAVRLRDWGFGEEEIIVLRSTANADEIRADIDLWKAEIAPVLGDVDTMVYAKTSDIASSGAYSGSKYNVLAQAGFRYFISNGIKASTDIYSEYVRQNRIMVTGSQMYYSASTYSAFFDSKAVLNSLRGNIPQA